MPEKAYDYQEAYGGEDYYWGVAPGRLCLRVVELLPPTRPLRLLDIGCGEGKDAVFFARCGYEVTAFDLTTTGVEKLKRLAERARVQVNAFTADVNDYRPDAHFDVIYSSGALHYIRPALRCEVLDSLKAHTNPGGLAAMLTLVDKPFIAPPPEYEPEAPFWRSGELMSRFYDWRIEDCSEYIFDCNSSGIPHRHAVNKLLAVKPA